MRWIVAGLAVWVASVVGGAASLAVSSSAQWVLFDLASLNTFVRLANETLHFVNERVPGEPVPFLPEIRHGVGLRLAETFGGLLRLGLSVSVVGANTRTQGTWAQGGTSHPVDIALEVGWAAFMIEVGVVLIPDVLALGISAGWGSYQVGYRSDFPRTLPTDWSLPFLPKSEDVTYTGGGPGGMAAVQVTVPLGQGISAGIEAGFRVVPTSVPRAGSAVLDLNSDGMGDPVGFSGPWLGLTVRMLFNL